MPPNIGNGLDESRGRGQHRVRGYHPNTSDQRRLGGRLEHTDSSVAPSRAPGNSRRRLFLVVDGTLREQRVEGGLGLGRGILRVLKRESPGTFGERSGAWWLSGAGCGWVGGRQAYHQIL